MRNADLHNRSISTLETKGAPIDVWVSNLAGWIEKGIFFDKREPGGQFMSAVDNAIKKMSDSEAAIANASQAFQEAAKNAAKQASEASGKLRDGNEKLGSAIDKLMKTAGRPDFAETVKLTAHLVDSLERLAVLEEKGLLDRVMKAMKG